MQIKQVVYHLVVNHPIVLLVIMVLQEVQVVRNVLLVNIRLLAQQAVLLVLLDIILVLKDNHNVALALEVHIEIMKVQ